MTGIFERLGKAFLSQEQKTEKPVVVILGMHNAGTSVLAQVVAKLGVALGNDLLMRSRYDDPPAYDYWEHAGIVDLQDRLLKTIGHHPGERGGSMPIDPQLWIQPPIRPFREGLRRLLLCEMKAAKTAPFGFKDPRTARLMPLWHSLFAELAVTPKFLIATRSCHSVAQSFAQKYGQPVKRGESLWRRTYLEALSASRGFERMIVRYEDWPSKGKQILSALNGFLDLQGDRAAALAVVDVRNAHTDPQEPLSALSAGIETLLTLAADGTDTLAEEQAFLAACNDYDARYEAAF